MKDITVIFLLLFFSVILLGANNQIAVNDNQDRWDDLIRVSPEAARTNPATTKPDYDTFVGNTKALLFDPSTDECVTFSGQIPHRWKLGTDIEPHVHWSPTTTNTGSVVWTLEYTLVDITGTFPSTTTISVTDAADGTTNKHQYADFSSINMSSYTDRGDVSIMIMMRLCRDADNGSDTYTGDAALLEFDIHGIVDSLGSQEETAK